MEFFTNIIYPNIVLITTVVINFFLGFLIISKNRRQPAHIFFFLFEIAISIWVLSNIFIDLKVSYEISLFFTKTTAFVNSFIPLLFLLFVAYFPNRRGKSKHMFLLVLPAIFFGLISYTSILVKDIDYNAFPVQVEYGVLFYYYAIYLLLYFISGIALIFSKHHKADGIIKIQIRYLILGFFSLIITALITNLVLPLIGYPDFLRVGPSASILFAAAVTYSMVKHRLMDIRLVVTRSLIYAILVLFVTGSFVLVTYLGSEYLASGSQTGEIAVLIITSILIVILLDPLKRLLAKATNRIFFKAAIDYPAITKNLTNVINEELELAKLVERFTKELEQDLRLHHATILLPVGENMFMAPEELLHGNDNKPTKKRRTNVIADTPLLRHLHENRYQMVVIDELDRKVADAKTEKERKLYDKMRTSMEEMNAYAVVPVPSTTDHGLEAVLLLSRKLSGDAFSSSDIELLEVIAPQMSSGIQKARLFQEAQQFNVKLQREIDKATKELRDANEKLMELDRAKSEFMSIASHQLRTPLAGIIGYLSMIEDGDFGEVNKEQQPIIHDVSQATQRLIRMVNIFLNVTRIEAGRFVMNYSKVPFADVIEAIYKELKPTADNKGVKLIYKKKALPEAEVDVDKIKDVILNLVDNAIKYSPKGRVEITAEANTRKVHVMVKDSGVGIAPEEAKNLFNKFVRGSGIARVEPNGSGLGLFIAKKITEGHGGKIWAESEGEGKGSTFQFTIPLKADKEAKKKANEFKQRAKG